MTVYLVTVIGARQSWLCLCYSLTITLNVVKDAGLNFNNASADHTGQSLWLQSDQLSLPSVPDLYQTSLPSVSVTFIWLTGSLETVDWFISEGRPSAMWGSPGAHVVFRSRCTLCFAIHLVQRYGRGGRINEIIVFCRRKLGRKKMPTECYIPLYTKKRWTYISIQWQAVIEGLDCSRT